MAHDPNVFFRNRPIHPTPVQVIRDNTSTVGMPDFDQVVLDVTFGLVLAPALAGMTLERLAVIGVMPPSRVDHYQMMINQALTITGEIEVAEDKTA